MKSHQSHLLILAKTNFTVSLQEIIPCLLKVLHQPIRAVAASLFTPVEKKAITSVVSILVSYGLTLDVSTTDIPMQPGPLVLKPEIHTLCVFEVIATSAKWISFSQVFHNS